MSKIIQTELEQHGGGEFNVLEIGSWAGQSSLLWAKTLKKERCPGKIFCVDPWMPFLRDENVGNNSALIIMNHAAQDDRIFPLFWHNMKLSGVADIIIPLRGTSAAILPILKDGTFDLIYLDGSHAYSDFINDLLQAGRLVKDGGILCGDDLELQADEVDMEFTERAKEKDFVTDPRIKREFHPGICLAVAHFFKRRISCYNSFWVQRRKGNTWEDVKM